MSACPAQTFTGITQARFDCMTQKAQAQGIVIAGNAGVASRHGVSVRWLYDPAGQTLELQCTASPPLISCGFINGKLQEAVASCP